MDSPPKRPSIVAEVARADLRFRDLLIEFPAFWRTFRAFVSTPRQAFAAIDGDTSDAFRRAFLFLTQALTVGFAVSALAVALPAYLVDFQAARWPLITGSREQLMEASRRLTTVEGALPSPDVARAWSARPELLLLIRRLPPSRFDEMIERLRSLSAAAPRVLDGAIEGRFAGANVADPRAYLRSYFITLRPTAAAALSAARPELGGTPSRWSLKPAIAYLVRFLTLWAVGAWLAARVLFPRGTVSLRPYATAAYAVGFAAPLWELVSLARNLYSGATLSWYATVASGWMTMPATASLVDFARSDGLFPFENAILAIGPLLLRAIIAVVAVRGAQTAFSRLPNVTGDLAWKAAAFGAAGAAGSAELIAGAVAAILAPIGLL